MRGCGSCGRLVRQGPGAPSAARAAARRSSISASAATLGRSALSPSTATAWATGTASCWSRARRSRIVRAMALRPDLVDKARAGGVDFDLNRLRLSVLGEEFAIGKVGADHQQRVAVAHHLVARLRAQQAN